MLDGRRRHKRHLGLRMDDEQLSLLRREQPQLVGRNSCDSLRGRQRGDFHLQLVTLPLEERLLHLQALDRIAEPYDIDSFPDEHKHETEPGGDGHGFHARPSFVIRCMTRNLALRDRGLRCRSCSDGSCGRLVRICSSSPRSAEMALNVCLTTRSSSEWNEMTHRRAPGANTSAASRSDASK